MDEQESTVPLWQRLPQTGVDGAARHAALSRFAGREWSETDTVTYRSAGRTLLIGPGPMVAEAAARLPASLQISVLATEPATGARPTVSAWIDGQPVALGGHLGAFRLGIEADGTTREAGPYDTVLDLGRKPLISVEVPPPGYYAVNDAQALEAALAALAEMVGEFEKPRYFEYDPDICAHGRSGIGGCTRCLDSCPTGAIRSLRERIEVDPFLCQGGGVCAATCPTGAIRYTRPRANEWLDGVRGLLRDFREAGGAAPVILLHDAAQGGDMVAAHAADLSTRVLPLQIEEVGAAGMDCWLSMLAYGAERVILLMHGAVPASVRAEIETQLGYVDAILDGLGYPSGRVVIVDSPTSPPGDESSLPLEPATFGAVGSKRELLRAALSHLHAQAPAPVAAAALPAGAPFGEIVVDPRACTLCMSCVSVCPAQALASGGETPRLNFVEWNCVQCGLCERACPESAITRNARILYETARQREQRTLHEEEPFLCTGCGKPFATRSVMRRMREKLAGHRMFQTPAALARLEMCEDCRVRDMFRNGEMG